MVLGEGELPEVRQSEGGGEEGSFLELAVLVVMLVVIVALVGRVDQYNREQLPREIKHMTWYMYIHFFVTFPNPFKATVVCVHVFPWPLAVF